MTGLVLLALLQAAPAPAAYEALVAQGIAVGKEGRYAEARAAFDRAIALDPRRPEAFVERGGLLFLTKDYPGAVRDLRRALDRRNEAYAREMLGAALYLSGRPDAALREWNRLGQPLFGRAEVTSLGGRVERVQRELAFVEGQRLTPGQLDRSRTRLQETHLFRRIRVTPRPRGREADVEVSVVERRGLADSGPVELVATTVANAIFHKVELNYYDVAGSGLSLASEYRWQSTQPSVTLALHWPRPFALPLTVETRAHWARPRYDLGSPLTLRTHGADVLARSVVGPRTVAGLSFRVRQREFSAPHPAAAAGRLAGLEAAVDHRVLQDPAQALGVSLHLFQAGSWMGSDLTFTRGLARLRYVRSLRGELGEGGLPPTAVALQLQWGLGSTGLPLDEMFTPGASATEMKLPLRAHRLKPKGILGNAPIARRIQLANLELRQRVWSAGWSQGGVVLFYDAARVRGLARGTEGTALNDIGIGVRLSLPGGPMVRLDYGRSVWGSRGKDALTIGMGQVF